jgi:hypothetical protein
MIDLYHGERFCSIRIFGVYTMPNATVRANARTLPNDSKATLEKAILAMRDELTAEPASEKRDRNIGACDHLLEVLAGLEKVR